MDIKHFPEWLSTVRGKHYIIILVNNQSISTHYLMVSITSDKIYKMGFYLKGFTLIIIFRWFFYPSFIQSLLSHFLINSSFMWLLTYPLPIPTSRRPELALPQRIGPECPLWQRLSSSQAQHGHFHELFQDTDSSHLVGQSVKQSQAWLLRRNSPKSFSSYKTIMHALRNSWTRLINKPLPFPQVI